MKEMNCLPCLAWGKSTLFMTATDSVGLAWERCNGMGVKAVDKKKIKPLEIENVHKNRMNEQKIKRERERERERERYMGFFVHHVL
jgi:hypothetical protein